ncbi:MULTISPECIES: Zn-ribbon domain-containing OB-fold protein [Mycobacterium avium complex (MAC)]|uniref:Zn-ribbon domain-containing OB-fold protein n=1 Tax=Mycobacterium avium complex (MAC) TaxID=120793 RepID=UPI000688F70C|nr:Zn-ribbon domain-containing OB-fold protein [Mycobacterium intracellulare]MCA2273511.1 Zn-ribbon domain-containing OB-fold protein [Mycobacterium intracellulare]MCA2326049.1 Zn-ribbon domain-containing OB-fold protein [Mycobacterium intracellulare]UEB24802.1 Zn-ribbon domain-containing OB-fold protein [Mycobacterium intracellulare]
MSEGFWAAASRHELVIQRCQDCGRYRHYPQPLCAHCHSFAWQWAPVSGRGVIYTFTITHRPFHPAWADRLPYVVATVELDEGVRMVSDLPPEDTDDVCIGAPVEVFFDDIVDDMAGAQAFTLPRFRLSR